MSDQEIDKRSLGMEAAYGTYTVIGMKMAEIVAYEEINRQMSDMYNAFEFAMRYHFLIGEFEYLRNIVLSISRNPHINDKFSSMVAHNIYV